jgi:hypothetical protein
MDKTKEKVITSLSIKYNIPFEVIELIVNSEFKFVIEKFREFKLNKEYKTIYLPKLGKFAPSPRKIKIYENRTNKGDTSSLLEVSI